MGPDAHARAVAARAALSTRKQSIHAFTESTMNAELPESRAPRAPLEGADDARQIERLARRRAGAKMGWYIHASVYVVVNLVLMLLSASRGGNWAVYPLLGWGLGLAIHGAVVFFAMQGNGLYERLLERERRALGAKARR